MTASISTTQHAHVAIIDLDGPEADRVISVPLFRDEMFTIITDTVTITSFGPLNGPPTRFDVTADGRRIESGTKARVDYSSEPGRAYKHLNSAPEFIHDIVSQFAAYTRPETERP
jgi:hypothetical protein